MKDACRFFIVVLMFAVVIAGCATIMHGTTQEVNISSNPTSARVQIDGMDQGNTPVLVDLKRKDSHIIKVELEGYQPYETALTRKVSGWVWGNIVFGGLVGLAVDAISGGLYKLTPEQVTAELRSESNAVYRTSDGIYVMVVLQPESGWEKIGQLTEVE